MQENIMGRGRERERGTEERGKKRQERDGNGWEGKI